MQQQPQADAESLRNELERVRGKSEIRYAIFLLFCDLYDPRSNTEPKIDRLMQQLNRAQPTISGHLNDAYGQLAIPVAPPSTAGDLVDRRRTRLTEFHRTVKEDRYQSDLRALVAKISATKDNKEDKDNDNTKPILEGVENGTKTPSAVRQQRAVSLPMAVAGAVGALFLGALVVAGIWRLQQPAAVPSPDSSATQTPRVITNTPEPIAFSPTETPLPVLTQTPWLITTTPLPIGAQQPTPPAAATQTPWVITATPLSATATPEATTTPAATPLPSSTPQPALTLPFVDDFSEGRRPEWRLISGDPVYNNGVMQSTRAAIVLELGDTSLTDYSIELDFAIGYSDLYINIGPNIRYQMYHLGAVSCLWARLEGTQWVARLSPPQCAGASGKLKVTTSGNKVAVLFNGSKISESVFENLGAKGPVSITMNPFSTIDNVRLTQP